MSGTATALRRFTPEDVKRVRLLLAPVFGPWGWLNHPLFEGLEHVPAQGPALYVGNHTQFGGLDAPLLFLEVAQKKGIAIRSLGDHGHFKVPGWGRYLTEIGVVDGTRENCAALFEAGEQVLVFPGGSGEVFKTKGQQYKLNWKDRLGFARLAITHKVPVIPFSAVGGDDVYKILIDREEIMASPIGRLLRGLGVPSEPLGVYRGVGASLVPRPERMYFKVAPPIDTARFGGDGSDDDAARALRDEVKSVVEAGIADLLERRKQDPLRRLVPRLWRKLNPIGR